MRDRVIWKPIAEATLAGIWVAAPDKSLVTAAANEIDARLARSPAAEGESRDEETRVLIVLPLGVLFQVNEDDKTVEVLRVWRVVG
jgi:hypothetical protein